MQPVLGRFQGYVHGLFRIVAGYAYMLHGAQKMFGALGADGPVEDYLSLLGLAGIIELCGGALIALGLFTSPVAFLTSGQMAVAYFLRHAPRGGVLAPLTNGGEPAVLFCFIFLYFAAAGGGALSLDRVIAGRKAG